MAFRSPKAPSDRTGSAADWLVVGLGNPGEEYSGTRHNVGAEAVEFFARRHGARLKVSKERARIAELRLDGQLVVLAIPTTFMNLSGESVRPLLKRYGLSDLARLVVVHDELDLPCGRVRIKVGGGLAGHNGLKSIHSHVHKSDFSRVRIGIGRPTGQQDVADFVLRRPGKAERVALDVATVVVADSIDQIVHEGLERAMNAVNARSA